MTMPKGYELPKAESKRLEQLEKKRMKTLQNVRGPKIIRSSGNAKGNLVLALLLTFLFSSVPAIALGAHYMNGPVVIYGLIVLVVAWILVAKYESGGGPGRHGHHGGYYYVTSRIGSTFRMWAVDRATRKRR